ncbi:right-handed parallel beta-helix repeat-containing protein [Portibacter marinus]|uniref:hypothetical protein n=1 Tax=Portibacter marinus TaxID=2898660 RepID=UPI001F1DC78F|nr:hypothetical protein [Portibacter marinus]
MSHFYKSLVILLFYFLCDIVSANDCNCTIDDVFHNSVESCTITYGATITVGSPAEFRNAITHANSTGGDLTILVENGTYQIASPSWYPYITASNVVIRSLSGIRDSVILTGTGMRAISDTENVIFAVGDSIVIADLTIRDCGNHGIAVSGDALLVHNIRIQNTYEQMLKGVSSDGGSDGSKVQCSLFEYTAGVGPNWYIGGIDVHDGDDWMVRDNIFRSIASPADRLAEHAIHFWNHSSNVIAERNWIINCDRGIGYGLGTSPASGGIIRNNMIYNDGTGLFVDVGIGLESCPDTKIYNNSIFSSYTNAIEYRFESTTNVDIRNNLTNGLIRSRNGGTATLGSNFTNAIPSMFKLLAEGNLRLVSDEIVGVIDSADPLDEVSVDIDQILRPNNNENDIGAHEYSKTSIALPLIQISDLEFLGGFRIPGNEQGESNANYASGAIAYNSLNHSIFLVGHNHEDAIAEFAIPELKQTEIIDDLNLATFLQDFKQILGSTTNGNAQNLDQITGMHLIDGRLMVNVIEYYDAPGDNSQTTLFVESPSNLASSLVTGYYHLADKAHAAGWISEIPESWTAELGGQYLVGSSSKYPIASRHSIGPSAFVFDPSSMTINTTQVISTISLLDFSLATPLHANFSHYDNAFYNLIEVNGETPSGHTFQDADATVGNNHIWTSESQASYGFIVPGTSSYLTLGSSGGHQSGIGYKATQNDGYLCGGPCPYHAEDYYNYYWLWDVNDLAKVKSGIMNPHDVRPYTYGQFTVPYQIDANKGSVEFHEISGGSFDPSSGILYLSISDGGTPSNSVYGRVPAIAAYRINTILGEEVRDGIDNNGDGRIDETLVNKWVGPLNGNWNENAQNWSSKHFPNSNNIVVIGSGSSVTIPIGFTAEAFSIIVSSNGKLDIPPGAELILNASE